MSFPIGSFFASNNQPIQTNYPTGYGIIQDGLVRWYDISQTASYQSSSLNVWNDLQGSASINITSSTVPITPYPNYILITNQSGNRVRGVTNPQGLPAGNDPFTIGMWIRPAFSQFLPTNSSEKYLYALGTGTGPDEQFKIINPTVDNGAYPNTYVVSGSYLFAASGSKTVGVPRDEWSMFVFTHSGSVNTYYINGNPGVTVSGSLNINMPDTLYLWGTKATNAPFFNWRGDIGQLFIYNKALSASEVSTNFLKTKNNYT
jgi:hypothetical protein